MVKRWYTKRWENILKIIFPFFGMLLLVEQKVYKSLINRLKKKTIELY